jgi:hypothetical protein
MTLSLKNDVNVASKSNKQKNVKKIILVGILKVADEKTRSVSQRGGSGSVPKCHGSATLALA